MRVKVKDKPKYEVGDRAIFKQLYGYYLVPIASPKIRPGVSPLEIVKVYKGEIIKNYIHTGKYEWKYDVVGPNGVSIRNISESALGLNKNLLRRKRIKKLI